MFTYFAKPKNFRALSRITLPWLIALTIILFSWGSYQAFVISPPDYQQGETVRIMYLHVPAAWLAMFVYTTMTIASVIALVWRHVLAELYTRAVAPIGTMFTVICLITGMLWGKPMWGTYWVWDARLTSVLVLLFIYLGYMLLINSFENHERGMKAGAILIILGFINIPIIKFSVEWWATLHQPASITSFKRLGNPAIDPSMLKPLLIMALAYLSYFAVAALVRVNAALIQRMKVIQR